MFSINPGNDRRVGEEIAGPKSFCRCILALVKREAKARVSTAWGDVVDCEESGASTIPLVKQLLERLNDQSEQLSLQEERLALQDELIQQLKDEIARLKGEKGRPKITPSTLEQKSGPRDNAGGNESDGEVGGGNRPGSAKRKKTTELAIHETQVLPPPNIPPGSVFIRVSRLRRAGYSSASFQYQDLRLTFIYVGKIRDKL